MMKSKPVDPPKSIGFRYTKQEYSKLMEVLGANSYFHSENIPPDVKAARYWLVSFDNYFQRAYIDKILGAPLEDMPLFINENDFPYRVIAQWRLKIGR